MGCKLRTYFVHGPLCKNLYTKFPKNCMANSLVFRTTSIPLQDMELRKMRLKVFIFKSKLHYVKSTLGA